VPGTDGAAVHGRFSRLYWQPVPRPAVAGSTAPADGATAQASVAAPAADAPAHSAVTASAAAQPLPATAALPEPAPAPTPDSFNPAAVPPLVLEVDDLRYRGATLGQASLRTRPVANGLQLESLQLRSGWQQADLSGEWTGQGD